MNVCQLEVLFQGVEPLQEIEPWSLTCAARNGSARGANPSDGILIHKFYACNGWAGSATPRDGTLGT